MTNVPSISSYGDLDDDFSNPRIAQRRFEAMAGGVAAMLPNQRPVTDFPSAAAVVGEVEKPKSNEVIPLDKRRRHRENPERE